MHPVPGALRGLRQDGQDGDRAAAGRGSDPPRQEHRHLRGQAPQSSSAAA